MSFGNIKSLHWLSTIGFSCLNDIFVAQPVKIMLTALLTVLRKSYARIRKEKEEDQEMEVFERKDKVEDGDDADSLDEHGKKIE